MFAKEFYYVIWFLEANLEGISYNSDFCREESSTYVWSEVKNHQIDDQPWSAVSMLS